MTPREAKAIRRHHLSVSYYGPHPLDGYSVAEFVKRCRTGAWTKPPGTTDAGKLARKIAAEYGDVTFEEI